MFLIDTNIVLNSFTYYPRDVFVSYWTQCETHILGGQFFFHEEVEREILRKDDEKSRWFRDFVPRAVSWYWVCVDVVLGGCALLVLAPASVRQGPGVG